MTAARITISTAGVEPCIRKENEVKKRTNVDWDEKVKAVRAGKQKRARVKMGTEKSAEATSYRLRKLYRGLVFSYAGLFVTITKKAA